MDKSFNVADSHQLPEAVFNEMSGHKHCWHLRSPTLTINGGAVSSVYVCCHCGEHSDANGEHGRFYPREGAPKIGKEVMPVMTA